jgi:outer membrane protein assembly factor BamB
MITHISSDRCRISKCIAVSCPLIVILLLPMISIAAYTSTTPSEGTTTGTWSQANYDYANTRDVAASPISSRNVNKLGVAWTFTVTGVSIYGALATSPIVVNGIVYLQDLGSNVYAIDLQSGTLKWEKLYNAPSVGPNGVAVDQGKVFVTSSMQTIAALDAATGAQLWSRKIHQPNSQGIDQQLTAYQGTLYLSTIPGTGITSFYKGGDMGIIYALDEQTGEQVWKTSVGQHQNDETQDIPAGQTITVLPGAYGGVETPMALANGVVYVPIVNAAAQFSATQQVGQVLSTGTGELDAIDVNTGKILWASPLQAPDFGGATVAGDLVFTSTMTGQVLAFNRSSGQQVWSWQSPVGINSPLIVVGDRVLVPAGLGAGIGKTPMLVALRVGATGAIFDWRIVPLLGLIGGAAVVVLVIALIYNNLRKRSSRGD